MGLSCGSQCAKIILFFFNFLFWLAGAGMLGMGIWFLVDKNALNVLHIASVDSSGDLYRAASIVIVVVGAVVFLTGFLGCCGAIKESPCMLVTYATILTILLLMQITAGILGAVFRHQILDELEASMNKTVMHLYGDPARADETEAYDFMQKTFKCCGVSQGPSDWDDSYWRRQQTNLTVPDSCCVLSDFDKTIPVDQQKCNMYASQGGNSTGSDAEKYVHLSGCSDSLVDWIESHAAILLGVVFGIAVIQLLGIIMACCLRSSMKKSDYQYV